MSEEPETPSAIEAVTGATFGALSRLRGARIFHPEGIGYTATLEITQPQPGYAGVPLLEHAGSHPAVMRFSRAVGLPEPLPDALGIAIRLTDVHGPGCHQDFLLVTSADGPVLHHLLLPGVRGFFRQSFSSLLLYRVGGRLRLVGARAAGRAARHDGRTVDELDLAAERGDLAFDLALAAPAGRWRPIGRVAVAERLSDEATERLAFTPWNTGGGIRPTGPFMGIRSAAYRGSQRGRGLHAGEIP